MGLRFSEEGEDGDYLLYADDLVLYCESEEDIRAIIGCLLKYACKGV